MVRLLRLTACVVAALVPAVAQADGMELRRKRALEQPRVRTVQEVVHVGRGLALPCVETPSAEILRCKPRLFVERPYDYPAAVSLKTIWVRPPRPYYEPTGRL